MSRYKYQRCGPVIKQPVLPVEVPVVPEPVVMSKAVISDKPVVETGAGHGQEKPERLKMRHSSSHDPAIRLRKLAQQTKAVSVKGGNVKEFFTGKNALPNSVQSFLNKHGDEIIESMSVVRVPLSKAIDTAINALTLGQISKAKTAIHADKLFHLYLKAETMNGTQFVLEKNEIISMSPEPRSKVKGADTKQVGLQSKIMSVRSLLENAVNDVGPSIYHYDPFTSNCQQFVTAVLKANGILTPELNEWINQDVQTIATYIPSPMKFLATKFTTLMERLQYLTGEGLSEADLRKHLNTLPMAFLRKMAL